jgi:DNA-binding NarL/FixJ family response regulator
MKGAMSDTERARVLIADDDRRVRRALRALLEAEDDLVVVGEVGTPTEVLARANALQPTVILLDLQLPTAAQGLALLPRLARWPVVALSVRGGLREPALRAGASAFVEKGAVPEALLAALRAAATRWPANGG